MDAKQLKRRQGRQAIDWLKPLTIFLLPFLIICIIASSVLLNYKGRATQSQKTEQIRAEKKQHQEEARPIGIYDLNLENYKLATDDEIPMK